MPGQQVSLDYYARLNVPEFSSKDVIKASYRKLALMNHPDRGGNCKLMQRINEAYDTLMKNKENYDALLRSVKFQPVAMPFDFEFKFDMSEIFAQAFTKGFDGWYQTASSNSNTTGTTATGGF